MSGPGLAIIRPVPIAGIGGTFSTDDDRVRLLDPDPKEAATASSTGGKTFDLDLGSVQLIDTMFIGYSIPGVTTITSGVNGYDEVSRGAMYAVAPDVIGAKPHYLQIAPTPYLARYMRMYGTYTQGDTVGVVAAGLSIRPNYGNEYGSGRSVTDTGTATRLFGGGFGIDDGARVPSYSWTFGDLQPDELRALWAMQMDRGSTRTVLVVEGPNSATATNEEIHWGVFERLEAYERLDPLNTRWSFQIADWA